MAMISVNNTKTSCEYNLLCDESPRLVTILRRKGFIL